MCKGLTRQIRERQIQSRDGMAEVYMRRVQEEAQGRAPEALLIHKLFFVSF